MKTIFRAIAAYGMLVGVVISIEAYKTNSFRDAIGMLLCAAAAGLCWSLSEKA